MSLAITRPPAPTRAAAARATTPVPEATSSTTPNQALPGGFSHLLAAVAVRISFHAAASWPPSAKQKHLVPTVVALSDALNDSEAEPAIQMEGRLVACDGAHDPVGRVCRLEHAVEQRRREPPAPNTSGDGELSQVAATSGLEAEHLGDQSRLVMVAQRERHH